MPTTDAASAEIGTGSTRRRLLGAGLAGSVLGAIGARRASASSEPDTGAEAPIATPEATTTTAAPRQPTASDVELLTFLVTVELAAADLYTAALDVDGLDEHTTTVLGVIREHHRAYGTNIAGRLGKAAVNVGNPTLINEYQAGFAVPDAANRARELELALVATHLDAIANLEGVDAAELLASIVIVEGQHVSALASLAGVDPATGYDAYVTETAAPLTSDDYPASA